MMNNNQFNHISYVKNIYILCQIFYILLVFAYPKHIPKYLQVLRL